MEALSKGKAVDSNTATKSTGKKPKDETVSRLLRAEEVFMRKLSICIVALFALFALMVTAQALTEPQTAVMYDCTWGMTVDEVRGVMGQETQYYDRGYGQTMLLYYNEYGNSKTQINFMFNRDRYLYTISEFNIGDNYQDAYEYYSALFTQNFGEPSTDSADGTEAGAMIALIEGNESETGFKGWKMDPLTLAVLSKDESKQCAYLEYRMKTSWGIGLGTLTTNPFSVDGIRFGDIAAFVRAVENPDAFAGAEDAISVYQCRGRSFAGYDAMLYFEFDDVGVSQFVYVGDGNPTDFFIGAMTEIQNQYGIPDIDSDYVFRWEIEPGVTCELSLNEDKVYIAFMRSESEAGE